MADPRVRMYCTVLDSTPQAAADLLFSSDLTTYLTVHDFIERCLGRAATAIIASSGSGATGGKICEREA